MTATSSLPGPVIVAPAAASPGRKWWQMARRCVRRSGAQHPATYAANTAICTQRSPLVIISVTSVTYDRSEITHLRRGSTNHSLQGGTVSLLFTAIGVVITLS